MPKTFKARSTFDAPWAQGSTQDRQWAQGDTLSRLDQGSTFDRPWAQSGLKPMSAQTPVVRQAPNPVMVAMAIASARAGDKSAQKWLRQTYGNNSLSQIDGQGE